jgi:mannose-1-phosphate guanylyltransferase
MPHPIVPVVLSGGSGSRLWPLSRTMRPKQFLGVTEDASLFQLTLQRLQGITADVMRPIVVATRVRHQMTQIVDLYRSPYFFTTTTGSFAHF